MKQGHSNVTNLEQIKRYPTNQSRILIELEGGASVYTVKELPPLSLSEEEWITIGQRAGWWKK